MAYDSSDSCRLSNQGKSSLIESGILTAEKNMDVDQRLLASLQEPLVRLYGFPPDSATYGYFVDPRKILTPYALKTLSLGRRPTGGGIIFHRYDAAFSILLPKEHRFFSDNTCDSYQIINAKVADVLTRFCGKKVELAHNCQTGRVSFCMARPTQFDLTLEGKKIGGAAQRRGKQGLLHQGSVAVALPEAHYLEKLLLDGTQMAERMRRNSASLTGEYDEGRVEEARGVLARLFKEELGSWLA